MLEVYICRAVLKVMGLDKRERERIERERERQRTSKKIV